MNAGGCLHHHWHGVSAGVLHAVPALSGPAAGARSDTLPDTVQRRGELGSYRAVEQESRQHGTSNNELFFFNVFLAIFLPYLSHLYSLLLYVKHLFSI